MVHLSDISSSFFYPKPTWTSCSTRNCLMLILKHFQRFLVVNLLEGMPKMKFHKENIYSTFVKGKQTKSSFKPRSFFSITDPFNLLHVDLFGPVPVKCRSRKSHFGDCQRFLKIYLGVFPSEKESFHLWNHIICQKNELLYDQKIRKLWSNHGTEFRNSTLEEFYNDKGITQNFLEF